MLDKTVPKKYFVRDDEQDYARLPEVQAPETNRYGKSIQLVEEGDKLAGKSLNINGDSSVSNNPNRYKQHGFYFNADNCISCHACESACSEKNDLPPYLAYRAVGYVEGGSYPNYTRMNISMACNHCDDPVCLKGCPTRAYTKFAEYGAVLQDPDICFGCGYCTWVCPYNAPQLDTEKGHVHKCNMCVDRLEQDLKPACASACLAGALDFGVIETTPENRDQLEARIPGFPSPEITHPNVRFQQTRSLPRELTRPDSIPLRYERDHQTDDKYKTKLRDMGKKREWNLKKLLSSHENAHIAFTLSTQLVMGAFLLVFMGGMFTDTAISTVMGSASQLPLLAVLMLIMSYGMLKLNLHLGKPLRFYRGFNNLRHSPVSREIAGVSLFFVGLAAYGFFNVINRLSIDGPWLLLSNIAGFVAVAGVLLGSWYMYKLYRIKARPFWDHWQTASSFWGNSISLGALTIAAVSTVMGGFDANQALLRELVWVLFFGLLIEAIGHMRHADDMRHANNEGVASYYEQVTTFGYSFSLRNVLLGFNVFMATILTFPGVDLAVGVLLLVTVPFSSIVSRALFYVLVIPTTMPGAFFWRNRGFQEHARETGLAEMDQVGVLPEKH